MKKQIKKLNLNKKTISNLNAIEMNQKAGGAKPTFNCFTDFHCTRGCGPTVPTQNGHTCNGNNC